MDGKKIKNVLIDMMKQIPDDEVQSKEGWKKERASWIEETTFEEVKIN